MTEPSPDTTQQAAFEEIPNPEASASVEDAAPLDPITALTQEVERWKDMVKEAQVTV